MSKQEGPRVRVEADCFDCAHVHDEHYAVQGDSGSHTYCRHPEAPGRGDIGDSTWRTPKWCPLLGVAVERLVRDLTKTEG